MSGPAMLWASRQKTGSPFAKAILAELARRCNNHNVADLSRQELALALEMGQRTLRTWLPRLEARGLVRIERVPTSDAAHFAEIFVLPVPVGFAVGRSGQARLAAPAAKRGRSGRPLKTKINNPLTPFGGDKMVRAVRDVLTDCGLDEAHAEQLIEAYALAGSPLRLETARDLADHLKVADPNAAALILVLDLMRQAQRPSRSTVRVATPLAGEEDDAGDLTAPYRPSELPNVNINDYSSVRVTDDHDLAVLLVRLLEQDRGKPTGSLGHMLLNTGITAPTRLIDKAVRQLAENKARGPPKGKPTPAGGG